METEGLIRTIAIVLAGALLVTNINFGPWITTVKKWFTWKKKDEVVVDVDDEVADKPFLEIVDLWYDLKGKCTAEGLDQAVEKLDEVFPLFNTSEEE